jgi:hypothetical protein
MYLKLKHQDLFSELTLGNEAIKADDPDMRQMTRAPAAG